MKTAVTTQETPKSKRLSSLIWIFILWGGVRACFDMDGISWTRAFWVTARLWGAIPECRNKNGDKYGCARMALA